MSSVSAPWCCTMLENWQKLNMLLLAWRCWCEFWMISSLIFDILYFTPTSSLHGPLPSTRCAKRDYQIVGHGYTQTRSAPTTYAASKSSRQQHMWPVKGNVEKEMIDKSPDQSPHYWPRIVLAQKQWDNLSWTTCESMMRYKRACQLWRLMSEREIANEWSPNQFIYLATCHGTWNQMICDSCTLRVNPSTLCVLSPVLQPGDPTSVLCRRCNTPRKVVLAYRDGPNNGKKLRGSCGECYKESERLKRSGVQFY